MWLQGFSVYYIVKKAAEKTTDVIIKATVPESFQDAAKNVVSVPIEIVAAAAGVFHGASMASEETVTQWADNRNMFRSQLNEATFGVLSNSLARRALPIEERGEVSIELMRNAAMESVALTNRATQLTQSLSAIAPPLRDASRPDESTLINFIDLHPDFKGAPLWDKVIKLNGRVQDSYKKNIADVDAALAGYDNDLEVAASTSNAAMLAKIKEDRAVLQKIKTDMKRAYQDLLSPDKNIGAILLKLGVSGITNVDRARLLGHARYVLSLPFVEALHAEGIEQLPYPLDRSPIPPNVLVANSSHYAMTLITDNLTLEVVNAVIELGPPDGELSPSLIMRGLNFMAGSVSWAWWWYMQAPLDFMWWLSGVISRYIYVGFLRGVMSETKFWIGSGAVLAAVMYKTREFLWRAWDASRQCRIPLTVFHLWPLLKDLVFNDLDVLIPASVAALKATPDDSVSLSDLPTSPSYVHDLQVYGSMAFAGTVCEGVEATRRYAHLNDVNIYWNQRCRVVNVFRSFPTTDDARAERWLKLNNNSAYEAAYALLKSAKIRSRSSWLAVVAYYSWLLLEKLKMDKSPLAAEFTRLIKNSLSAIARGS